MTFKTSKNASILLGSHMSIAGGLEKSLYRGASIGCTAIQIFSHSNRQWIIKDITIDQINQFEQAKKDTNIYDIIVHASYLINLGSKTLETRKKSLDALDKELIRCEQLNIPYLVLHPGSGTQDTRACCNQIIESINELFQQKKYKTTLLLENMAGQGSSVGTTFEQLGYMINNIDYKNVGVCFDTCHAYAAGYDFSTQEKYETMWKEFNSYVGLDKVKAIHMNDSKKPCGSRVDRHEHIGKGLVGLSSFELIMNDPNFQHIPKILETPKSDDLHEDLINMNILKNLVKETT